MRALLVIVLIGVCAGCAGAQPAPSIRSTSAASADRLERTPVFPGYSSTDTRLQPVYTELRAHPEWLDEPFRAPQMLGLVPSTDRLCLALRGTAEGDLFVAIDPEEPWTILSVAIDRGEAGREITYDTTGLADDICAFVILGRRDPWPESEASIEVTGNVAPDEARAIARATFVDPQALGLDRHGIPAIAVGDPVAGGDPGWNCRAAMVYVGGPRSEVVIGTRPDGHGGWLVTVRPAEPALFAPPVDSAC